MAKTYYKQDIPSLLAEFDTDANKGLSDSSAKERLAKYGANALLAKRSGQCLPASWTSSKI